MILADGKETAIYSNEKEYPTSNDESEEERILGSFKIEWAFVKS